MSTREYRPRRVALGDGQTLALRRDGTINHLAPDGTVLGSWAPADPGWPQQAIRFGLHVSPTTVHPSGRDEPDRYPAS